MSEILNTIGDNPHNYGEGSSSGSVDQLLRQSFNRFDEKLVETILSYLTFNEKVLFECVSKQFKRCVYSRQTKLHLMPSIRWDLTEQHVIDHIYDPVHITDYNSGSASSDGFMAINKFYLKSLLKKCKSIESVIFDCFVDFEDLDIICSLCPKIKSLELETRGLNAVDLAQFGQKYGHMLSMVRFNTWYFFAKYLVNFLINCKQLKSLTACINTLFSEDQDYMPSLEHAHVYQLHQDYRANDTNLQDFGLFCERHKQTMTRFSILAYNEVNNMEVDSFVDSFSKLTYLKDLDFSLQNMRGYNKSFEKQLVQLSQHCPRLERLNLWFFDTDLKTEQFFSGFEGFHNLLKLKIFVKHIKQNQRFEGSVECLKSAKNLKHLFIDIKTITEQFFEDIHKYLPNLRSFIIITDSEITDKTVLQLSHLKKLKEFTFIGINSFNDKITDESICAVIKGCPHIEKISFGISMPNITNKTIEALIGCANSRPKIGLTFECRSEVPNLSIDLNIFAEKMPQNLTLSLG